MHVAWGVMKVRGTSPMYWKPAVIRLVVILMHFIPLRSFVFSQIYPECLISELWRPHKFSFIFNLSVHSAYHQIGWFFWMMCKTSKIIWLNKMQQTENVKSEQIVKTAAMIIYRYVKKQSSQNETMALKLQYSIKFKSSRK